LEIDGYFEEDLLDEIASNGWTDDEGQGIKHNMPPWPRQPNHRLGRTAAKPRTGNPRFSQAPERAWGGL